MPRIISEVTPTIEQRLAGWVTIHERQVAGAGTRQRPTLTISREFGCEGFPLAARLKELLDESTGESWTIFDRALIEMVAEDAVVTPRVLRHLGDMPRAFEAVGFHAEGTTLTQDAVYQKIVRCLVPIARAGNAIIVGRGGAVLCQGLENCFHFRLIASLDWRAQSYARRMDMSVDDARRAVVELSEMRTSFLNRNLGTDIADPKYYDAIFSNERRSIDEIARAIVGHVRSAWRVKELFQAAGV
ncbi:MAG: cytidylate kinase-like family protein [Acidobacteria bacterium]|nr:cytidylate kinase-like family protein [Acidobacteriota bacterium]